MLPLDSRSFYEDRSRYPWQLSRFSSRCRPCVVKAGAERAASRREQRNAQVRKRRALLKANRKLAGFFCTPQWLAIQTQQEAAEAERKVKAAWTRRQFNRLRGPYVDPVKALIRANQVAAAEKRKKRHEDAENPEDCAAEQRHHLALLRTLRDKHRSKIEPS